MIRISLSVPSFMVMFTVSDNGFGMSEDYLKEYPDNISIFLFTSYDWSEIEQEANEIGINRFMPKPFFVSTFKDAVQRTSVSSTKKTAECPPDVIQGMHILVVDDLKANQFILVKILNTLGARCDTAGNGQEAVGIINFTPTAGVFQGLAVIFCKYSKVFIFIH